MKKYLSKAAGVILATMLVFSLAVSFFGIIPVYAGSETDTEQVPACEEHTWGEWTVTVKATYFKKGSQTRTCEVCGETETADISKKTAKNKWVTDSGKKYYFGSNGKPVKGWKKIRSSNKAGAAVKWCWFNKSGVFKKAVSKNTKNKWVTVGKKKFYFGPKKKPLGQGFHVIKNKLYYLGKDKAMKKGKFKVKGKTYRTTKRGNITGMDYYRIRYKNFVLIDLSSQKLNYYRKGKRIMRVDIVSGTPGDRATPTGIFSVKGKARNVTLSGPTWSVPVSYWMPFFGGYGMHDAGWRSSGEFSNHRTYRYNGSHGCVNMRYKDAAKLYSKIKVGTTVIIQK